MMIRADLVDDDIVLSMSNVDRYRLSETFQAIPGLGFSKTLDAWQGRKTFVLCKTLRGFLGDQLEVSDALNDWAFEESKKRIIPCMDLRDRIDGVDVPGFDLKPYQAVGVEFLTTAEQALLCDEMGTGKTWQTVVALRKLNVKTMFVCAPKSVKGVWSAHFARLWPAVTCFNIEGGAVARKKVFAAFEACEEPKVLVGHYDILRFHSKLAPYGPYKVTKGESEPRELNKIYFDAVVFDEGHKIKSVLAKQTRAAWAILHAAKYRFILTGTPIGNTPADLWSLLHGIAPDEWRSRSKFIDRYCYTGLNWSGREEVLGIRPDTREEFEACVYPRMRRITKELVLPQLPPIIREVRIVELDQKQRAAYNKMRDDMIVEIDASEDRFVTASTMIARLTRLQQFACAYATVDDKGNVRMTDPSSKLDELEDVMESLGDEPLVVFSRSRQLIELCEERFKKAGIDYRVVKGGQSDEFRNKQVDEFQAGQGRVMLVVTQAGGMGITLTRARVAVFINRSASFIDETQAESRVHRIGSEIHDSVLIIDIIARDTVDENSLPLIHNKRNIFEDIVRDKELLKKFFYGEEV